MKESDLLTVQGLTVQGLGLWGLTPRGGLALYQSSPRDFRCTPFSNCPSLGDFPPEQFCNCFLQLQLEQLLLDSLCSLQLPAVDVRLGLLRDVLLPLQIYLLLLFMSLFPFVLLMQILYACYCCRWFYVC